MSRMRGGRSSVPGQGGMMAGNGAWQSMMGIFGRLPQEVGGPLRKAGDRGLDMITRARDNPQTMVSDLLRSAAARRR